jgi:hypothetical protein
MAAKEFHVRMFACNAQKCREANGDRQLYSHRDNAAAQSIACFVEQFLLDKKDLCIYHKAKNDLILFLVVPS